MSFLLIGLPPAVSAPRCDLIVIGHRPPERGTDAVPAARPEPRPCRAYADDGSVLLYRGCGIVIPAAGLVGGRHA
jgi:hypothetical protein